MRFHLIDRVDAYEPGKSVRARKLTSLSEEYWEDQGGGSVMPQPFLLEALCQAGTWLIMATTERRKRAALLSVGAVEFLDDARPGDVLDLLGSVESMNDEVAVLSGQVKVDGRLLMEAKDIMCALIDGGDLADADTTERLQKMLFRYTPASTSASPE
jgi:3-hydroxyacyl-[acyl-carrier-protein] dehydratase